jgi:hypothetical protein
MAQTEQLARVHVHVDLDDEVEVRTLGGTTDRLGLVDVGHRPDGRPERVDRVAEEALAIADV